MGTEDSKNNTFKTTIHELLDNLNFTKQDSKSVIAVLSFILVNGVKNCITSETLNRELTDLGIPKENCTSIVKIFKDNFSALKSLYRGRTPMHNEVDSFQVIQNEILLSSHDNNSGGLQYYDLVFEKFFVNSSVNTGLQAEKDPTAEQGEGEEDLAEAGGNKLFNDKNRVLEVRMNQFMMLDFKREMNKAKEILLNLDKL